MASIHSALCVSGENGCRKVVAKKKKKNKNPCAIRIMNLLLCLRSRAWRRRQTHVSTRSQLAWKHITNGIMVQTSKCANISRTLIAIIESYSCPKQTKNIRFCWTRSIPSAAAASTIFLLIFQKTSHRDKRAQATERRYGRTRQSKDNLHITLHYLYSFCSTDRNRYRSR